MEPYDLVTPDAKIVAIDKRDKKELLLTLRIDQISPYFAGFKIPKEHLHFNLKSAIAQLGVEGELQELDIKENLKAADLKVKLIAVDPLGMLLLESLTKDAYVGKLFAADETRRVRNADYLTRMFGRSDRAGYPLLTLGGLHGSGDLILEKIDGRCVAFLNLKKGCIYYDNDIYGMIPTFAKGLCHPSLPLRELLKLHQMWNQEGPKQLKKGELLLVKTLPLHVRTVYGRVVNELLPKGFRHTSASILQPNTFDSGDIYELYGESDKVLDCIPIEFYTLEPYKEHVFFSDRDQLQACLEKPESLFKAMQTAPQPKEHKTAVFVVKGTQLLELSEKDWVRQESIPLEFPGFFHPSRQALMVDHYIKTQPSYPFFQAIENGDITSQGILLTRYFPSPLLKRFLLSELTQKNLKGIYFSMPSRSHGMFFSHEDRSLLLDLAKFGIPIFWVDESSKKLLQYVPKPEKDTGMFVPIEHINTFIKSTVIGIYGSNLFEGDFEKLLHELLSGLLAMKTEMTHPLLNPDKPLALLTGGGPGAMSLGNRVAKSLNILSCANIVDFSTNHERVINEQKQNPYIDAKMTYRLDRLVERQAEFNLDLPLFLMGGIGTDFEYTLEEVRRKIGSSNPTPVLLIGPKQYWKEKISSRFQSNLEHGTIKGSEWVSNCFFCVEDAKSALKIYRDFFSGSLPIGEKGPVYKDGFYID